MKWTYRVLRILLLIFILSWPIYIWFISIKGELVNREEEKWNGIITMWDYPRLDINKGTRYTWITRIIKDFERKNPGVYIQLEPIDWEKGHLKLEAALKTGNLPDIAPIGSDYEFMKDDTLETLDNYIENKDIFRYQALKAVTNENKIWGVPFLMTTYGMYLNMDLFNKKGVDAPIDGNWTYGEFIEKMKKLTYDSDGDGDIDNYGFTSFIDYNKYNLWGIILSDGASIININNDSYAFKDDRALSGLNKVIDLKEKYKVTPKSFGLDNEKESWTRFYKDKNIAAYPTGSWAVSVLNKLRRKGEGFNFKVVNYPIGDNKLPVVMNNTVAAYGITKQSDKRKLKMCIKFLEHITNKENQRRLKDLGVFSVREDINDMYVNDENMNTLNRALSYSISIPKHDDWNDIDRILQNQIRLAIIGEKTAEEALEDSEYQINVLLDD